MSASCLDSPVSTSSITSTANEYKITHEERTVRRGLVHLAVGPPVPHDRRQAQIGAYVARADDMHGHAARRQFRPERFAVPLHGELRSRVTRTVRRPDYNTVGRKGAPRGADSVGSR